MTRASSPRTPHAADPRTTVTLPPRERLAGVLASPAGGGRIAPTIARWPLEVASELETGVCADPATAVVRRSLADYRAGRADAASRAWAEDIVWTIRGAPPFGGEWTGPEGVFEYHALLVERSDGTYRQRLVALEGCRGPIVEAFLRTTANRAGRRLDIPTLAVFELGAGRIRRVTELPGDLAAWESFWAE